MPARQLTLRELHLATPTTWDVDSRMAFYW